LINIIIYRISFFYSIFFKKLRSSMEPQSCFSLRPVSLLNEERTVDPHIFPAKLPIKLPPTPSAASVTLLPVLPVILAATEATAIQRKNKKPSKFLYWAFIFRATIKSNTLNTYKTVLICIFMFRQQLNHFREKILRRFFKTLIKLNQRNQGAFFLTHKN